MVNGQVMDSKKDASSERGVFLGRQEMRELRFSLADGRAWGNGGAE